MSIIAILIIGFCVAMLFQHKSNKKKYEDYYINEDDSLPSSLAESYKYIAKNELKKTKDEIRRFFLQSYIDSCEIYEKYYEFCTNSAMLSVSEMEEKSPSKNQQFNKKYENILDDYRAQLKRIRKNIDVDISEDLKKAYTCFIDNVTNNNKSESILTPLRINNSEELWKADWFCYNIPFNNVGTYGENFQILGADNMYDIYPRFIVEYEGKWGIDFNIYPIKDVSVQASKVLLPIEKETPKDAKLIKHTYKYLDKNGNPINCSGNIRQPLYECGKIVFKPFGLVLYTSTPECAFYFSNEFNNLKNTAVGKNTDQVVLSYLDSINELIGLSRVKNEITTLTNSVKILRKKQEMGMKVPNISYHCVFLGNSGTGKTTVARILGGIYKDLGILKSGHLVETDRSGLVAEYVGQTAVKTNKIIDEALNGVLFIDEAYSLVQGGNEDYGKEAIATLLKRMEDDRNRLVVILAGYTNEIETFINSNPGLRSRFNRYIHFEDYSSEELFKIFLLNTEKNEYKLTEEAKTFLQKKLEEVITNKQKDFGNARYVRNLFEKTIETQANRLATEPNVTKEMLTEIQLIDLQNVI